MENMLFTTFNENREKIPSLNLTYFDLNALDIFFPILVANIIKKVKNKINLGAPKQMTVHY